ncbi:MAG TPA: hypothetical protein PKE12_07310 [Kiritimatiellia bacterium]|nr:hypothetical protein [Kiritimatiellia bacterium]
MRFLFCIILAMVLVLTVRRADCGEAHVEDFSDGANTSDASLAYGIGSWTFTGGTARVRMTKTAPYAYPDVASLSPKASAFAGDWMESGHELVGFKFMAGSPAPSHLYLELLASAGRLYRKIFPVPEPGEWTTFMASITDGDGGGWIAVEGTIGEFQDALRNVERVSVNIQRAGALAVEHAVDDFFLDRLPRQVDARITSAGAQFSLDALQSGALYTLQASASLTGPWQDVQTMAATNRLQHLELPLLPDASVKYYRLLSP